MKIIVLVKQVPEMERVKFDTEKGVINRKSAGTEINPFDLNALEAAVQIKEEIGGQITAVSMGPKRAESTLKEAIARGADEGILVTDRKFAAADTRATSYLLAETINRIDNFDLIIAGEKTVDGDTGQVGPETAEYLNIPHVAYVTDIKKIEEDNIELVSSILNGQYLKKLCYPGLITVTKDLNHPRLPSLKDKMKAKKAEIKVWDFASFKNVDEESVGLKGSPTWVNNIIIPDPIKREGKLWREDNLNEAAEEIYEVFCKKNVIGG